MAKRIKKRITKEIMEKRKQYDIENPTYVFIDKNKIKKVFPDRKKRKEYISALIKDLDN